MISDTERTVFQAFNQTSGIGDPDQWLVDYFNGGTVSSSGVHVNARTALGLPAVYASVQLIAGMLAAMPLMVKRRNGQGADELPNHPASKLLNRRPNELQTSMVFRETLMLHALLQGDGRAIIIRNSLGQPIELVLTFPESSYIRMWEGEKWHCINIDPRYYVRPLPDPTRDNTGQGGLFKIRDKDVIQIPNLSSNGLYGMSMVDILKDAFGIDKAGQDSAGFSFRNNGRPGIILQAPKGVMRTQKEATEFMSNWDERHEGIDKKAKSALLREGITATTLPLSQADAQFIESRGFSREDIATIFGTQHILGEGKAVYKDLSERMTAFITTTLSKWMSKWVHECGVKLLSQREKTSGDYFFEFDSSQFVKGDPNTLADYTGKLRTQGLINGDEARLMHGMNPAGLTDYDNPTIAKEREVTVEREDDDSDDDQQDEPTGNENAAVRRHFQNMINAEAEKLVRGARREENYLAWLDTFYASQATKYADLCEDLELPVYLATDYCENSKSRLLEVCGVVTQEQLPAAVADAVENWSNRIGEFRC